MKSTNWFAALSALALVVGCVDREGQQLAEETKAIVTSSVVEVSLATVERRSLLESLNISGEIVSPDDVSVSTKTPGRIIAIYVKEGESVTAGQTVAQLEITERRSQVRQARAQLDSAKSALAQAKIDAMKASGIHICENLGKLGELCAEVFK